MEGGIQLPEKSTIQKEISGYISNLFRIHFGKGPTAVYVTVEKSFITIHFRGFLAAMEKNLVNQAEMKRVLTTRNMIIRSLEPEIIQAIEVIADYHVKEFYTDWNFKNETGLMIGIINENLDGQKLNWPEAVDEQGLRTYIDQASEKIQKKPDHTDIYWLNDRTLLVRRSGVLLEIEKEFVKNGFLEELQLSRRPLEYRAFQELPLENVLKRNIDETFLYWSFDKDLSYTVFRLAPEKH